MYSTLIFQRCGSYYWHVLPAVFSHKAPPFGVAGSFESAEQQASAYLDGNLA